MNVARIGQTSSGADGHLKRSTKRASLQRPLQPETSRCKEAVATGREPVFLRTSPLGRTRGTLRARERKCAASASTNTAVLCLAVGDHILGNTTLYHLDYSLRSAKSHAQAPSPA